VKNLVVFLGWRSCEDQGSFAKSLEEIGLLGFHISMGSTGVAMLQVASTGPSASHAETKADKGGDLP